MSSFEVQQEILEEPERGEATKWLRLYPVSKELGVSRSMLLGRIQNYRESHPHWFKEGREVDGRKGELFAPELIEAIRENLSRRGEPAPEGWVSRSVLARKLGMHVSTITSRAEAYLQTNPDWSRSYISAEDNKLRSHFSPKLVEALANDLAQYEEAPPGWLSIPSLGKQLGYSENTITRRIAPYRKTHPHWFGIYSHISNGIRGEHLSPELAEKIRQELPQLEKVPEGWMTLTKLASALDVSQPKISTRTDKYRESHPEWFQQFRDERGHTNEFLSPELIEIILEELGKHKEAPEGWVTVGNLAKSLSVSYETISRRAERCRASHPEWFQVYLGKAERAGEHIAPELVENILNDLAEHKVAPEGWMPNKRATKYLNVSQQTISRRADQYRESHPEWFQVYRDNSNRPAEHYSPELLEIIRLDLIQHTDPPEGWVTLKKAISILGISQGNIKRLADQYRASHPEWFQVYLTKNRERGEHLSPELIEALRDQIAKKEVAPAGWITENSLSTELKIGRLRVASLATPYRESHPEWFHAYKPRENFRLMDHISPELADIIRETIREEQNESPSKKEVLLKNFEQYGERLGDKNSLERKEIEDMIKIFGPGQVLDILYALHPEYRGIPIKKINSTLAQYLGDYLLTSPPFSLENLEDAKPFLGVPNLIEGLKNVIKIDALQKVLGYKETTLDANIALFRKYFEELRRESDRLENSEIMKVIIAAEKFYISLLSLEVPEGVRKRLQEGREFPDLYQRINIREIEEKKRLMIADEMGAGKSGSAILAKEYLKVETALVVVPSNAIDTWQGYLSNQVDENGKKIGYFQESPKVLVVSSLEDIAQVTPGLYEYILISHERLTRDYTEALQQVDYGMLIVDEVHKLKNVREGVRSEHLLRLAENREDEEKYVALLSGTPVPNKVEDVAMILKLLYPERFADQDNKTLVRSIIHGDLLNLRQLLLPRLQMKNLGEHIEMPDLLEAIEIVELTAAEEEIYQVLLDEDELTPMEKMQILQKFLLNPKLLDITPETLSTKIEKLNTSIQAAFAQEDRVVLYVNDYIEDVIRGENNILQELTLPAGVEMRVIHGEVPQEERLTIQREFQRRDKRVLLVVSGQTADVAVDYSAGQKIIHYNEPWTVADKRQQQSRVYRPGIDGDVESLTLLTKGTIEEGKHEYIQIKHRAIEKLLRGIPITEIEMELLERSESAEKADLSVNSELADYYFSSFERLNRIFASVKEIGEEKFSAFLERHGAEYADCYRELGSRSYQSNASRVVATVIERMAREQGKDAPRILDLGSGPEMLWRHSSDILRPNIVSVDINPEHFKESVSQNEKIVGSFTNIPLPDASVDYVNLSLALHYTRLVPSKNIYERLEALREMSRVLKTGGRAVVNMIYSLDFRDPEKIQSLAESFGLRVVEEYSGEATSGAGYRSRVVTFEKSTDATDSLEDIIRKASKEDFDALKLNRTDKVLKDSRKTISSFTLGGEDFSIELNAEDQALEAEEKSIVQEVEALKVVHGSLEEIPRETIIARGFVRIRTGKSKYILFKKIPGSGAVIVR